MSTSSICTPYHRSRPKLYLVPAALPNRATTSLISRRRLIIAGFGDLVLVLSYTRASFLDESSRRGDNNSRSTVVRLRGVRLPTILEHERIPRVGGYIVGGEGQPRGSDAWSVDLQWTRAQKTIFAIRSVVEPPTKNSMRRSMRGSFC
jgi:hypothetical protein